MASAVRGIGRQGLGQARSGGGTLRSGEALVVMGPDGTQLQLMEPHEPAEQQPERDARRHNSAPSGLHRRAGQQTDTQVRYQCHGEFDAVGVRALFFNTPPAEVVLVYGEGGAERMLRQHAASGARYANGDQVFWIKGETATWQRGRTMRCKVMEARR